MADKLIDNALLVYLFGSIFFMNLIFIISVVKSTSFMDIIISFVFLTVFVFVFYLIVSFLQGIYRLLLTTFLLGFVALIYSSQLIYFHVFKTFYSIYSLGNGMQVMDFWSDIGSFIITYSPWIILLYLPTILLIALGEKLNRVTEIDGLTRLVLVFCIVLTQLAGIRLVHFNGEAQHTAYDLYYKNSYPLLSVQRLGLLTTMRLDFQRLVTSWSPDLEEPIVILKPTEVKADTKPEPTENEPKEKEEVIEDKEPEYNVMDIDFPKLIKNENSQEIIDMHTYFSNVQPTEKNDYTGIYEGYNLILITAEGFSPYAVHPDVTPTLYKMVNDGYRFPNFYTPIWGVSTSDGEYVALTSLIPKNGVWSFEQSGSNGLPFVMGNQLKKLDYQTNAYHNHSYTYYGRHISHPNMGYDYKGLGNGLQVKETWPESDLEMMELTVPEYINNQPFHAYYMTVSGHMQYSFTGNYIAWKNKKYVEDLAYSEQAKAYLATQIELDLALKHLLDQLEKAGIAEKTLIALSADHYPYGLDDKTIDEFVGHPVEKNFELYQSTFILYTEGMEPETITKQASSLDIIPTLSNLLGLEYDSRLLMGIDIFSDSEPLIPFVNKSFITDKGRYNSVTKEFIPNDGETIDDAYVEYIASVVQAKFFYSAKILETDYYRKVFAD